MVGNGKKNRGSGRTKGRKRGTERGEKGADRRVKRHSSNILLKGTSVREN